MIPILYDMGETLFESNGLGRLYDIIRCECYEERNGIYEVEFDYPVTGAHYDEIICGRIIAVRHDESKDIQPFDIYKSSKPIDGIVTFNACHISYRQRKMVVANGGPINNINDAFTLLGTAVPDNPFNYETDIISTNYMSGAEGSPKTVRQLLGGVEGSILDTYGGEYEWDKFTVKLWENRGQTTNYTIRYGLNMVDFQDDTDYSETYNAVIPFWTGQDENGIDSTVVGSMVESGTTMYDNRTGCAPLDLTDKFESKPTAANLEAMALSYMSANQTSLPSQNIKVDFIRLQDLAEYEYYSRLQNCKLCDSVRVIFSRYNTDGYFKIVKTTYDVLADRYISMELGTLSTSLADAFGDISSSETTSKSILIEKGTSGIWTYRKWEDGTAECWGRKTYENVTVTASWGSGYYAALGAPDDYPFTFYDYPTVSATLQATTGYGIGIFNNSNYSVSNMGSVYAYSPTSNNSVNMTLNIYAIGRWK